jgi:hypothetical protein
MAKVLLITTPVAGVVFHVKRVLNTLGIASDVMYATAATRYALLEPASGVSSHFNPTTSAMRDFLRRYNAIFVIVPLDANNTSTTIFDPIVNTWMQNWNAPEDPPVFSFGYNFNTRFSSLPSDFPIIPADTTNDTTIANTMWRWETGIFREVSNYRTRIGTRVRLLRENVSVYTRSVNYYWGNNTECAAYLVDIRLLGGNSELLAVPDFPDQERLTPPPDLTQPAFAVRYKNHYFLPHLHNLSAAYAPNRVSSRIDLRTQSFPIFWALYALKLAGIAPARKIPLVMEFDHPVEPLSYPRDYVMAGQSDTIPYYEQVRRHLLLTPWLLDFAKPRGLQFIWSGRNGRRAGQGSDRHWWTMLYGGGSTADAPYESGFGNIGRGYAQAQLKILQANPDVFAMGIHDHTIPPDSAGGYNNGRYATIPIYRHTDPGYRFAAPNPIPTQTGNRVINRRVLPKDWTPGENDFLFPRGRETFVDVYNASVTTASNYTGRDGTYWAASVFLERNRAEMAALGLPHHGGDNVRYTNHARNTHGGEGYWDAWVEQGFRGFRVVLHDVSFGNVHVSGNPHRLRYRGIQFIPSIVTDFTATAAGFYHSSVSYSDTAFGEWRLEDSTARELSGTGTPNPWMSDANWRREKGVIAIRRWLSAIVDMSLYSACCWQGTFYAHPCAAVAWVEAVEQALADASPFEGDAGNQYWNGRFISVKEHLLALDTIVQVLSDYLKWGTITELLNLREAVE